MREQIIDALTEIEENSDIHILSAREMGSRLIGAEHADSDWDIMFIYAFDEAWKYPANGYSKKSKDFEDGEMDFHGWNLDKFADHMKDSNPQAMEFLAAEPYMEENREIWREIEKDAFENFNHMALYYHYISLAKSNYTKYIENGNDCTQGRQFYITRALATAQHIRRAAEFPPMRISHLANSGHIDEDLGDLLIELGNEKRSGRGDIEHPDIIGPYYDAESAIEIEPTDERTNSPDPELTNKLFKAEYGESQDL